MSPLFKRTMRDRRKVPALGVNIEFLESRLLLSAGQLDASFGTEGTTFGQLFPGGYSNCEAFQPDGKIIVAGATRQSGGAFALARFNANGLLDRTFGDGGRVTDDSAGTMIQAVALQPDGRIVVAGMSGGITGPDVFTTARYLPNGTRDATFGADGVATLQFFGDSSDANAIAIQADGDIVVGGEAHDLNGGGRTNFALARFTSSGVPDKTFGTGGAVTNFPGRYGGIINSVLLQPDGRIIAGGEDATEPNGLILERYNPDGTLDGSFGTGGTIISSLGAPAPGPAYSFGAALLANGQILVPVITAANLLGVARFDTSGSIDTMFGNGGIALMSGQNAQTDFGGPATVLVQHDGRIIESAQGGTGIGAFFSGAFAVARFTSNGNVDSSFGTDGLAETPLAASSLAYAALLQPDGKIVVAGVSIVGLNTGADQSTDFALARFMPNGQLDDTFGFHGAAQQPNGFTGDINAVAVQADGKILTAGSELAPDPSKWTDAAIARYNPDGSLDTSFGVDGRFFIRVGSDAVFNSLLIEPDGKILAGGSGMVGKTPEFLLARLNADGTYDHSFDGTGVAQLGFAGFQSQSIAAMAFGTGGKIIVGGTATDAAGADAFSVARYLPDGRLDPTFAYGGRIAGHPLGMPSEEFALAATTDGGVILAGSIGGQAGMVRLDDRGKYNAAFGNGGVLRTALSNAASQWAISAIALDSQGNIVAGGGGFGGLLDASFHQVGLYVDGPSFLAKYSPLGVLDPSFGTGGLMTQGPNLIGINALALQPDGKIVVGGVYYDGSVLMPTSGDEIVARFDSHGFDTTFGVNGVADLLNQPYPSIGDPTVTTVPIRGLAIQPDGKILAGAFDLFRLMGE